MKKSEIELGQKVKDLVTGFSGIVIGHMEHLNGCHQLQIKRDTLDKDGVPVESVWIDIEQLKVVGKGIIKKRVVTNTGGSTVGNLKGHGMNV